MLPSSIVVGDSLTYLRGQPPNSVDLILTDPPYDISKALMQEYHTEFLRVCKGDILVFCSPKNQWVFPDVQWLFWVKPTSTKNYTKRYGNFVEMIAFYKRGEVWNPHLQWANYTGIWSDIITERLHEFSKPESLIERFIRIHTNP